MSELSEYYRFRNQFEAAIKFVDFGQYTRMQWDNVLKPIYRESSGEAEIKTFAAWIANHKNRETIQYRIATRPQNVQEYWRQCFAKAEPTLKNCQRSQ